MINFEYVVLIRGSVHMFGLHYVHQKREDFSPSFFVTNYILCPFCTVEYISFGSFFDRTLGQYQGCTLILTTFSNAEKYFCPNMYFCTKSAGKIIVPPKEM